MKSIRNLAGGFGGNVDWVGGQLVRSVRGGATLTVGLGLGSISAGHVVFTAPNAVLAMDVELRAIAAADWLQVSSGGIDPGGATLNVSLLNASVTPNAPQTFLLIANAGNDPITNQFGVVKLPGANATRVVAKTNFRDEPRFIRIRTVKRRERRAPERGL